MNIINLCNIADYQQDAIVSKTIIDEKGGSITFFAFSENQKLSEHTAPYDAFVQILEGEAEIKIGEKIYILKSEESIIMPADIPHAITAKKRFKMLLTMIKRIKV